MYAEQQSAISHGMPIRFSRMVRIADRPSGISCGGVALDLEQEQGSSPKVVGYFLDYIRLRTRVERKIAKINIDLANSSGLTKAEIDIAIGLDLIDSDQAYFWTEEWQEGYRQAQRDIEEGSYETFKDANSLLDYLRR